MSRYIDEISARENFQDVLAYMGSEVKRMLKKVPTADVVEVRHGKWINNHCTVCGMTPIGEETWTMLGLAPPKYELWMSFCPCCGAKMDGERREE
jgi:hypothetical protein